MKKDKKKIAKKGIAVLLAGTMIGTMFVGCSKQKRALLEDTILDGAQVMTVDEEPIIVTPKYQYTENGECRNGKHYKDVVTGTIYHVSKFTTEEAQLIIQNSQKTNSNSTEDGKEKIVYQTMGDVKRAYACSNVNAVYLFEDEAQLSALTNKLTADELKKAQDESFTDEDVLAIQERIADEAKTLK